MSIARTCGLELSTAPFEVLCGPGGRNRVGLANDYERSARAGINETLHSQM